MLSVYWEGHLIFFGPITKNSDQNNKKNLDDPEVDAFFSLDDVELTEKKLDDAELKKSDQNNKQTF